MAYSRETNSTDYQHFQYPIGIQPQFQSMTSRPISLNVKPGPIQNQVPFIKPSTNFMPEYNPLQAESRSIGFTPDQTYNFYQGTNTPLPYHNLSSALLDLNPNRQETVVDKRIKVLMEAQTAGTQKTDNVVVTYLNKSQYYVITLEDTNKYPGTLESTIILTFFDQVHLKMAGIFWGFWLSQQPNLKTSKALMLDQESSTGVNNCDDTQFERVTVSWDGRTTARLLIKFNCLSTDFSRIKGIKGIPLRIHVVTYENRQANRIPIERCFAKVQIYRDKGAERKKKEDIKNIHKIFQSIEAHPRSNYPILSQVSPFTEFTFIESSEITGYENPYHLPPNSHPNSSDINSLLDRSSSSPVLCLFVKLLDETIYHAVYLNQLSVKDLIEKVTSIKSQSLGKIHQLIRLTSSGAEVQMDDTVVSQMVDEMDIHITFHPRFNHTLILNY